MESALHHASHGHQLQLMGMTETNGQASSCRACSQPFKRGRVFYGCCHCGYFLHRTCAVLKQSLPRRLAHPQHPLRLFYATDAFSCNICGKASSGFSYRCESCNFSAHSFCVQMPRTARNPGHPHHLLLSYQPPSRRSTYCDACRQQVQHACYSCCTKSCAFDLHPQCIATQLLDDPGRKKGYKRAKIKKILKRTGGIAKRVLIVQAVVGVATLGAAEAFDDDDLACSDDDDAGDVTDFGDDDTCFDDDFEADMDLFYDSSECTFDDEELQEEATSLLLSHMQGMGMGGGGPVPSCS